MSKDHRAKTLGNAAKSDVFVMLQFLCRRRGATSSQFYMLSNPNATSDDTPFSVAFCNMEEESKSSRFQTDNTPISSYVRPEFFMELVGDSLSLTLNQSRGLQLAAEPASFFNGSSSITIPITGIYELEWNGNFPSKADYYTISARLLLDEEELAYSSSGNSQMKTASLCSTGQRVRVKYICSAMYYHTPCPHKLAGDVSLRVWLSNP